MAEQNNGNGYVYAKVEGIDILEYPLTIDDINERGIPTDNFIYCYFADKPIIDPNIDKLIEHPKVYGDIVIVTYTTLKKTIDELFAELALLDTGSGVDIQTVPSGLLNAFVISIKDNSQKLLDDFAKTRGYDDIKSACTYFNSTVEHYRVESARCIYLRDIIWNTLYVYLNKLLTKQLPLPTSWNQIVALLPPLTWE